MDKIKGLSIIIPTWNNLPYLKVCIDSIRKNSTAEHQIIVHINEGSDGTLDWVKNNHIPFTFTGSNAGICRAVNYSAAMAAKNHIVYINDDMYVLPGWDKALMEKINLLNGMYMLSATMIEPADSGNSCVIVADFGKDIRSFNEAELLENFIDLKRPDWSGASWPPVLITTEMWNKIGGFSEEFSPGMYSDPDFSMKCWKAGCRTFIGIGNSLVYHFQCKSTGKVVKNNGRKTFIEKWGFSASDFYTYFLKMGKKAIAKLPEPSTTIKMYCKLKGKLKLFFI